MRCGAWRSAAWRSVAQRGAVASRGEAWRCGAQRRGVAVSSRPYLACYLVQPAHTEARRALFAVLPFPERRHAYPELVRHLFEAEIPLLPHRPDRGARPFVGRIGLGHGALIDAAARKVKSTPVMGEGNVLDSRKGRP